MMRSDDDKLDEIFGALANSTRRAILARLAEGEATVNELAEPFLTEPYNMSLPAISKHIKVLEHAGLVTKGQDKQYRPCTLDVMPLQHISSWTEQYRHLWEASFDRMDSYINQLKSQEEDHD